MSGLLFGSGINGNTVLITLPLGLSRHNTSSEVELMETFDRLNPPENIISHNTSSEVELMEIGKNV